jgi:hypothetical protein
VKDRDWCRPWESESGEIGAQDPDGGRKTESHDLANITRREEEQKDDQE